MARGSQLSQLKSALSDAGLTRQSQTQSSGKKRKRSAAVTQEKDKDKATRKLREINERLNPFDVKVTRLKHDVGGRKLKGVTGRPGLSKQTGIEQRKKTLLVEYEKKNHSGGVVDRRFGENDPTMAPEDRMLERFTWERQRASKGVAFNLEDEDDLTHYGQSLSAMDDFDSAGLGLEDEETNGQIDRIMVGKSHFGGFRDENEDGDDDRATGFDEPVRKKSKAEAMAEVIAKSKEYKYQRQMEKEVDENTRFQLDNEFDTIRGLLFHDPGSSIATGSNSEPLSVTRSKPGSHLGESGDKDYDQFVRELGFEKRAKPKDRTKTEEEQALEEKQALEKSEKARLRRMMGIEGDSEEDEGPRGRKRNRKRGGDDLEDDFADENNLSALGAGLDGTEPTQEHEQDSDEDSEKDSEENESAGQSDEDERDRTRLTGVQENGNDAIPLVTSDEEPKGAKPGVEQDIPFTFPCPASHDKFFTIVENIEDRYLSTVIQRIRALHHPSLSKDNPLKLQVFISVLIDHVLHVASLPTPRFTLIETIVPHIFALSQAYPVASAEAFVSKLTLMHKNLIRGLAKGATFYDSKTWPGSVELSLLRVIGVVWSTSDMNHAVVSAARILMGAYLGLARIRSISDVASGLFICTLFLQYEEFSKRLIPEAINFLLNTVLLITPHRFKSSGLVPGSFPVPDFAGDGLTSLQINKKLIKDLQLTRPNLLSILSGPEIRSTQSLLNLLGTSFQLLGKFAEIYKALDGFVELYTPVLEVIEELSLDGFPIELQKQRMNLQQTLTKLLKFAVLSRRPLLLQAHKPIPIPSYVPKFSSTSSNYLRNQDPDHERAAASKLRTQVKQERKGAIRELRKDAHFLASVQQQREMEESKEYSERMKRVFSSIEGERAEQRSMEREKARKKKRVGKN